MKFHSAGLKRGVIVFSIFNYVNLYTLCTPDRFSIIFWMQLAKPICPLWHIWPRYEPNWKCVSDLDIDSLCIHSLLWNKFLLSPTVPDNTHFHIIHHPMVQGQMFSNTIIILEFEPTNIIFCKAKNQNPIVHTFFFPSCRPQFRSDHTFV